MLSMPSRYVDGAELMEGDNEGCDDGKFDGAELMDGFSLGVALGASLGLAEGVAVGGPK